MNHLVVLTFLENDGTISKLSLLSSLRARKEGCDSSIIIPIRVQDIMMTATALHIIWFNTNTFYATLHPLFLSLYV